VYPSYSPLQSKTHVYLRLFVIRCFERLPHPDLLPGGDGAGGSYCVSYLDKTPILLIRFLFFRFDDVYGGAHVADGEGHSGVPGGVAGHLGRVIGDQYAPYPLRCNIRNTRGSYRYPLRR
jgi:hypothetical protein